MRPNIEISHALNGRVKDYAAENDITTAEAYCQIIESGLRELTQKSDTGGTVKVEATERESAARHANHDAETHSPPTPHEPTDDTHAIVARVSASWDDDGRLDDRRAAASAALSLLDEEGKVGKQDAIDELLPTYSVPGQDDETWWRKNIRPLLREVATYSKAEQAYVGRK